MSVSSEDEFGGDLELEEFEPDGYDPLHDAEFVATLGDEPAISTAHRPELSCPFAEEGPRMYSRGKYARGYPIGAVVHFTAGRYEGGDESAVATMRYGASRKHSYYCISTTGKIFEPGPLDQWGSHAGRSYYAGLGNWLSSKLVGIEICNAGLLTQKDGHYLPWWNKSGSPSDTRIPQDQVRNVEKKGNVTVAGPYHKYTAAQEDALHRLLVWMHENSPSQFKKNFVLGHDEIAVNKAGQLGRKQDPGGAHNMLMPALRASL